MTNVGEDEKADKVSEDPWRETRSETKGIKVLEIPNSKYSKFKMFRM
jgi:hypothetical protein